MFTEEQIKILKALECVAHNTHECSKQVEPDSKCSICDLGFIYIAEQPSQLSCGHCVCISCTNNHQKKSFKCDIHDETEVTAESHMARLFMRNSLNILYQFLSQKYESTISLFQTTRAHAECRVEEEAQMIKDQIDIQVEKRKQALNLMRENMHKEVDQHAVLIKKSIVDETLLRAKEDSKILKELSNNANEGEYFKCQNSLVKLISEIQVLLGTQFKLKFNESSNVFHSDEIIGTLKSYNEESSASIIPENLIQNIKVDIEETEENNFLQYNTEVNNQLENLLSNTEEDSSVIMQNSFDEYLEMQKSDTKIESSSNSSNSSSSSSSSSSSDSSDSSSDSESEKEENNVTAQKSVNRKKRRSYSSDDTDSELQHKPKKNKKQSKETPTYRCDVTYKHSNLVRDMKYMGDGRLVGCSDGKVKIWDIKAGKILYETDFDAFRLFVTSDKTVIATGNNYRAVLSWNPDKRYNQVLKTSGIVTSIEEIEDGILVFGERIIAGKRFVNNLKFLKLSNSLLEYYDEIESAHNDTIQFLKKLPGDFLASSSKDNQLKIWHKDAKDRYDYFRSLIGHKNAVTFLKLFDNKYLLTCSFDKKIRIWDYEAGICVKIIEGKKPYHQMFIFGNFIACRNRISSVHFDIYEIKDLDFKFVRKYSIKSLHTKQTLENLLLIDNRYFACSYKWEINLTDFNEDLNIIKNDIENLDKRKTSK